VPITPILPEAVVAMARSTAGEITSKIGMSNFLRRVSEATLAAELQAMMMVLAP
jgi:hypothetical protein